MPDDDWLSVLRGAWQGRKVFIVAGGPSVLQQNLELLRGQRVIAVNSSVFTVPWADILIFSDSRWWRHYHKQIPDSGFRGTIISLHEQTSKPGKFEDVRWFKKGRPPGLSSDQASLTMRRTTISAALNLAQRIAGPPGPYVLLGADGKRDGEKRCHHHAPHPWAVKPGCWDEHRKELSTLVEPLTRMGITVLNASPGSAWDMWPIVTLEQTL